LENNRQTTLKLVFRQKSYVYWNLFASKVTYYFVEV